MLLSVYIFCAQLKFSKEYVVFGNRFPVAVTLKQVVTIKIKLEYLTRITHLSIPGISSVKLKDFAWNNKLIKKTFIWKNIKYNFLNLKYF